MKLFIHLLILGLSGHVLAQSPMEAALQAFRQGIAALGAKHGKPLPSKGQPFGQVQGPKCKNAKIGIVGAGVSGTHMAWLLKRAGYTDVTILEKTDRVGGKSENYVYRGVDQYVSTVIIQADYG